MWSPREGKTATTDGYEVAPPQLAGPPTPRAGRSLFGFLDELRDNALAIFGPEAFAELYIESRFFWRRTLLVNDPAGIRHVLLDNAGNYTKTLITRELVEPGLGQGLLTSEGETWRRHRRIMAPAFDHRSIVGYAPIMTAIAEDFRDRWTAQPAGETLDVAREMMHATLLIIARTMFSSDSDAIVEIVEHAVGRYQNEIRPGLLDLLGLPDWVPRPGRRRRADRALGAFNREIERLIAERTRQGAAGPRDLLGRLLAARDEETGSGMSRREIRDQVVTIFMAGHETTALALTWTWYLLALHPAAEARLHGELAAVLGGRAPGHDDLAKLPYTRMVIEEAMRLYPPAHTISREATDADSVGGHRIAPGTVILIAPWVVHRHRRLWETPERFDPERFAPARSAARPRYAYLPFGAGPRICIGAAFAMAEAMLVLATLAQRCRLRLAAGHRVEPQGLITLRPRTGMTMTVEPR